MGYNDNEKEKRRSEKCISVQQAIVVKVKNIFDLKTISHIAYGQRKTANI